MANATDQLFVGGGEFLAGAAKIAKSEEGGALYLVLSLLHTGYITNSVVTLPPTM